MKKVGVLRGGKHDYENSIQKGGEIISHVFDKLSDKYKVLDIFVDKDNVWHLGGRQIQPAELMHKVDVVWNASHPSFSNVLQSFSIPCVGIDVFNSFLSQNRSLLEENMRKIGVQMPRHLVIPVYQEDFDGEKYKFVIKKAKEVHAKFAGPWIVRSFANNSSMGIHVAETFPKLVEAIDDCVNHNESILVEELISGKNVSIHTMPGFRGKEIYSLPVVEHRRGDFVIPGNLSDTEKENLLIVADQLHKHFNNPKYLHSEFVLNLRKGIFLKNIEFNFDLNENSHFCKSCESVGANACNIVEHILESVIL